MNGHCVRTVVPVVLLGLSAAAIGWFFSSDWGWAVSSSGLLILLGRHLKDVFRLNKWAAGPRSGPVPEGTGIWKDIFDSLYLRQRTELRRRMRFARLLARSTQVGRALPYGVAILDAEHRILWCNDASERHFGISAESDAGQPITNLVRQPEFVAYVAAGNFSEPLELKETRTDGLMLSIQFVPYIESRYLLLSRDVTLAAKIDTMRRDFVANVSHELRTPLTVLVGFLETVRELKLDPERSRDYFNLMTVQGRRMERIIDDLLTLSTLESAPEPLFDERVDVVTLLERIRAEAEALSGGRHRITLEAKPGYDLLGVEAEIASAFGNLANNAVRYTAEGGEVRLLWRASEVGAEFAVEDTGPGIEKEHLPRLTERFYRVDRGRSRESGGTGLGLAIVKHALSRHQATLKIESEIGKGSRFTAIFPARRLVAAPARQERIALQ